MLHPAHAEGLVKIYTFSECIVFLLILSLKKPLQSNEILGEKARWELYKNATCCFKQILEVATHKAAAVRPFISHLINHPSEQDMLETAGEAGMNS